MNKIPVLDKGYVGLLSSSLKGKDIVMLKSLLPRGTANESILDLPRVHLVIKCPIFVQTSTANYCTWHKTRDNSLECFIPSINDINARDLQTSKDIQQAIEQTTEALMMNPKSFAMDGCDAHIAQCIVPVSAYTTFIATGSLSDWISYINREDFPVPVKAYCEAIRQILLADWNIFRDEINGKKKERKG